MVSGNAYISGGLENPLLKRSSDSSWSRLWVYLKATILQQFQSKYCKAVYCLITVIIINIRLSHHYFRIDVWYVGEMKISVLLWYLSLSETDIITLEITLNIALFYIPVEYTCDAYTTTVILCKPQNKSAAAKNSPFGVRFYEKELLHYVYIYIRCHPAYSRDNIGCFHSNYALKY